MSLTDEEIQELKHQERHDSFRRALCARIWEELGYGSMELDPWSPAFKDAIDTTNRTADLIMTIALDPIESAAGLVAYIELERLTDEGF